MSTEKGSVVHAAFSPRAYEVYCFCRRKVWNPATRKKVAYAGRRDL